jgi:hypothetical protein
MRMLLHSLSGSWPRRGAKQRSKRETRQADELQGCARSSRLLRSLLPVLHLGELHRHPQRLQPLPAPLLLQSLRKAAPNGQGRFC